MAWLNPKQFAYVDVDDNEIINGKNCAYTIHSHLHGPKGSHFVEVKLKKLADRDTGLHNWDMLVKEVKLFCKNAQKVTVNKTLMEIRKIDKAFEAYALFSHSVPREVSNKPNEKKHFGRKAEVEVPQGADDA